MMPFRRSFLGPGFAPRFRKRPWALSAGVAVAQVAVFASVAMLGIGTFAMLGGSIARAGGGPENIFLVVNPASPDSLAVANAFATLRQVPPINVFMLPWTGGDESASIKQFREEILVPILRGIDARRLSPQIDCIVYAPGFPWRIDYAAELPAEVKADDRFPSASLTGMTMLYAAVQSGVPAWLAADSNRYYRPVSADGVPASTIGFRGWYGWGPKGELLEAGGVRYLLSVMLGVTAGRGNNVDEILACLQSAARADGTRPPGTMYFMTSSDIRTTTRSAAFPGVVRALEKLGVEAEIASGTLPVRKRSVAGLMAGTPSFDWRATSSTIVPGAICENLTSFGGIFTPSAGQTPLSEFIRAGAAGSSGTVTEPFSLQAKFPHPSLQVHYARGASLAEAFYQSVQAPYQLIVVGDPLCQPWATIPEVEVVDTATGTPLEPGQRLAGRIALEPRASRPAASVDPTPADAGPAADRFELFVDGIRVAQASLGERLSLDTTELAEGHHEIRVVAIAGTPVATQGRRIIPVKVANHDDGRGLELVVEPQRVPVNGMLRIGVRGSGIDGAVIFSRGRVLGRTSLPEETIEVPAELLGRGSVVLRATGRRGPSPADAVNAAPVTVTVNGGVNGGR